VALATISQAAIWFFSEKIILATSAKYRHPITSFTKTECNKATHSATTHKTEHNNTQDQMQQHTPLLNYGECFHVDATSKLRKRLLLNDAGTNQCHRQTG
jgi:hypothetical protein